MDKIKLSKLAELIRKEINGRNLDIAVEMIEKESLSNDELDFVLKCLRTDGYDVNTGKFLLLESDNSAFLKLVESVEKTVKGSKDGNK